jgi:hypothetical protein
MANVGILSMQRIINYGSFLQAYGLKAMLEELGHTVQFVDYHVGEPLVRDDKNRQKTGLAGKIAKGFDALGYDAPMGQKLQFIKYKKEFAEKYHGILGITKEPNYTPELDVLVIGSDEVFNCVQKNANVGYSPELFGKDSKAIKTITYAASFGNTTLAKLQQYGKVEEIGTLLKKLDSISVRDENTAEMVKALSGREVEFNLDPVLAYDFIGKCSLIPQIKPTEKYLILYAYSGRISRDEAEWISAYAKKKGLKVYAIGGVQKCADRYIDCSPFEVLSYFLNAEEVITDTFHGTIFSVIAKRRFATIVRRSEGTSYGNEEKLTDLLKRLGGLDSRAVYNIEDCLAVQEMGIDYEKVQTILEEERAKTWVYLERHVR